MGPTLALSLAARGVCSLHPASRSNKYSARRCAAAVCPRESRLMPRSEQKRAQMTIGVMDVSGV